ILFLSPKGSAGGAADMAFLRGQLEDGSPPDVPFLERGYVAPEGVDNSIVDGIWLGIAPLISLGYAEDEITKEARGAGFPRELQINDNRVLVDYSNLRVSRNLDDGEVSVEIPLVCNFPLPSAYYEVKGVKKRVKLYNVTCIRYYNISLNARKLYNVTYAGETGGLSKAVLSVDGDFKGNVINAYLPDLGSPVSSRLFFNMPLYGIVLSLEILEHKAYRINFNGREVDYYWLHMRKNLKVTKDTERVKLVIGHGGGWIVLPWLVLREGEYVSEHWIKWTNGGSLTVELIVDDFKNTFLLCFNKTTGIEKTILSRVLSEDELKVLSQHPFYGKLNQSGAMGWSVRFVGEKVSNETVWVSSEEYEQLARLGWKRGNSIFIDSGEVDWGYTVTSRTIGECKSIKLFYSPLKINRGELLHGIALRNYANTNVSYSLRLKTATNHFLFFTQTRESSGSITLNKTSTGSVLLIQREPAVGEAVFELVKDGRVVAAVKVSLALKTAVFWKGFWDGLLTKLPGIAITAGMMIAVSFLIPKAYVRYAYYLMLGIDVLSNLMEVASDVEEAYKAREEMLAFAEAFEKRAGEFLARGEVEHAAECMELAVASRREANETMSNIGLNVFSNLAFGVSLDEIRIALGLKEPIAENELEKQYKIGYARGRVTGAVVSCMLYVTLFVMVNRVKAERIGQRLTTSQILRTIARGVYNWVTPAVWDAITLTWGRIRGSAGRIVDLLLGNKYSRGFGEAIGSLLEKVGEDPSILEETIDASSRLSKQVLENVPRRESARKILDVIGLVFEEYSLEELRVEGGRVVRVIVSVWAGCGDEAVEDIGRVFRKSRMFGEELLNWLGLGDQWSLPKATRLLSRTVELNPEELENIGRALAKVGESFENRLRLLNTYLVVKESYGETVAKAFLNTIVKDPGLLNTWHASLESGAIIFIATSHDSDRLLLPKNIPEGVYLVLVHDPDDGSIIVDKIRRIVNGQESLRFSSVETTGRIRSGCTYLTVLKPATIDDFLARYPSKFVKADGFNAYLVDTRTGRIIEGLAGRLDEYAGSALIRFMVTNADGEQLELRVTEGGRLMLVSGGGRTMIGEVELKTVRDGAGGEVARLLFLREEGSDRYGGIITLNRRIPQEPIVFLSNDEHVIEIRSGQKYLDVSGMMKRIIGEEYRRLGEELSNRDAVLGIVYRRVDGGVDSAWTQSADAEFKIKEAEEVLGILIVRKNGLSAVSSDGSVRAELSGEYLKFYGVEGMSDGNGFKVSEARFRELSGYGPILEVTLHSSEKILFRIDVGRDGKSVSSKLALAIRTRAPEINPIKYYGELKIKLSENNQVFEYAFKDTIVVEYKDNKGIHRKVISLSKPLPDKVLSESQHVVAKLFTKELLEKLGYIILEEESLYDLGNRRYVYFDFKTETPDKRIAIVECKHGDEESGNLIGQADKYLEIADENNWKLIYSFLHAPQEPEAERLFEYLVELMRRYPDVIEVFIGGVKYEG
ncbi:MAG: hypothetical protein QXP96_02660, partial [Thermoproteota archaeon]